MPDYREILHDIDNLFYIRYSPDSRWIPIDPARLETPKVDEPTPLAEIPVGMRALEGALQDRDRLFDVIDRAEAALAKIRTFQIPFDLGRHIGVFHRVETDLDREIVEAMVLVTRARAILAEATPADPELLASDDHDQGEGDA